MKDKVFVYSFIFVAFLSFFLRFWQLGKIPPSLNVDEVALGYNAYSILRTGKDEYGQKFPLVLRSFDDYKPPIYSYSIVPAIYLFGKNDFAVRFPSAAAGFLTTILVFFLVWELTNKKWLALTSSFLLAISPWHIQYSRLAYESNLALFLVTFAFWAFLKARKKGFFLSLSAICFGLSFFTYHAARLLSPIFVLLLGIIFLRDFLNKGKWVLVSALIGFLFIIPLVGIMQGIEGQMRPWVVSIFSETQPKEVFRERLQRDLILGIPFGNIWHNRRLIYFTPFVKNYLAQFRPEFLFAEDINHHAPDVGLFYLWQIPFIFLGIHYLISKERLAPRLLIIFWFVLSPLAAALSWESPSSFRALPLVIPSQIIIAYGLFFSLVALKNSLSVFARLLASLIFFFIFVFFVYYLHMYFVHLPFELPYPWGYGRAEAAREAKKLENDFKKIIVSTNLHQVYIYFLFYTDYDPQTYLKEGGTVSGGFIEMKNRFGKYEFHLFDICPNPRQYEDTLLIWDPKETHLYTKILKLITSPDGKEAVKIGVVDPPGGNFENISCK